jgi:putative endonuclease
MDRQAIDRQAIGRAAEDVAVAFLESQGLAILLRNFRRRAGELDVIARDRETLVIAEVRTRSSNAFGGAAASIDSRKQRRLLRAAEQLLQQRKELAALRVRFDVIIIHEPTSRAPRAEWIKHAFAS